MNAHSRLAKRPAPRRSFDGSAALIGIGVVVLLNSLGWLGWDLWEPLARLWPVLLIASGLNLLAGRPSHMLSALLAFGLVIGIGAAVVRDEAWQGGASPVTTQMARQSLEAPGRDDIELAVGGGLYFDPPARHLRS
jgi:hypothetical protein